MMNEDVRRDTMRQGRRIAALTLGLLCSLLLCLRMSIPTRAAEPPTWPAEAWTHAVKPLTHAAESPTRAAEPTTCPAEAWPQHEEGHAAAMIDAEGETDTGTGWYYEDSTRRWYYHVPDASAETRNEAKNGWHHDIDGFTYYLDIFDGHMLDGRQSIDGVLYDFLSERNRGNYHQNAQGRWYYRANGRATYGSLQYGQGQGAIPGGAPGSAPIPPNQRPTYPIVDSTELVRDHITIPKKETGSSADMSGGGSRPGTGKNPDASLPPSPSSPSEIPRPSEIPDPPPSTPSEIPDPSEPSETPDPSSPSEIPDPSEPSETPDPPTPPEDERRHEHSDDPAVHCIALGYDPAP